MKLQLVLMLAAAIPVPPSYAVGPPGSHAGGENHAGRSRDAAPAPLSADEFGRAIRALDHDEFADRDAASKRLLDWMKSPRRMTRAQLATLRERAEDPQTSPEAKRRLRRLIAAAMAHFQLTRAELSDLVNRLLAADLDGTPPPALAAEMSNLTAGDRAGVLARLRSNLVTGEENTRNEAFAALWGMMKAHGAYGYRKQDWIEFVKDLEADVGRARGEQTQMLIAFSKRATQVIEE